MVAADASSVVRFGPFELQASERLLLAGWSACIHRPRTFDVLVAFGRTKRSSRHQGRVVEPRLAAGGRRENALQAQISGLRKILGAKRSPPFRAEAIASCSTPWNAPSARPLLRQSRGTTCLTNLPASLGGKVIWHNSRRGLRIHAC